MKRHYFLADLRRLWKGYEVYAAILGVAATLFFSMESRELKNGNVMFSYFYATEMSGFMIAYVFCAFPYAASLCEDLEHKYVRYQTVRGSLKRYVASKVGVVYLSSVLAMVLGSMLFVAYCRTQGPWVNEEDIGPYVDRVISVEGYNQDGEALAKELNLVFAKYPQALSTLVSLLPLYYQQGHGVHPASGDLQGSAGQNRPWDVHRACVPCIQ